MNKGKIIICFILILLFQTACSNKQKENPKDSNKQSMELDSVKTGYLSDCPNFSIDELINNYLDNAKWSVEQKDNTYNVSGLVNENGTSTNILMQFVKDGDTISLKNVLVDDVDKSQENNYKLIMKMCQNAEDKKREEEHKKWLKDQEDKVAKIPNGYVTYQLNVNMLTTYNNSFFPDSYIDLYDYTSKIIVSRVKVLQVLDKNDNYVFDPYNTKENREPSKIIILITIEDKEKIDSIDGKVIFAPAQ